MTRLLIPNGKKLPEPTGDGIEGLPVVCFTIESCAAHRCGEHTEVPQLNETDNWDGYIECGACAYEAGRDSMRLGARLKRLFGRGQSSELPHAPLSAEIPPGTIPQEAAS